MLESSYHFLAPQQQKQLFEHHEKPEDDDMVEEMLKIAKRLHEQHLRQREYDSQLHFFCAQLHQVHRLVEQQQIVIEWLVHNSNSSNTDVVEKGEQPDSENPELQTQVHNVFKNTYGNLDYILPWPQTDDQLRLLADSLEASRSFGTKIASQSEETDLEKAELQTQINNVLEPTHEYWNYMQPVPKTDGELRQSPTSLQVANGSMTKATSESEPPDLEIAESQMQVHNCLEHKHGNSDHIQPVPQTDGELRQLADSL